MNNKVCCVIVTYNIGEKFYNCYNSIKEQVNKVVIVDNGSNEETVRVLKKIESSSNSKIIYNDKNLGIAKALNQGVEYSKKFDYDWILTLDNDSEATKDMVASMLKWYGRYENKEEIKIIFPEYIEKKQVKNIELFKSNLDNYQYEYILFDNTSGNLVKATTFEEVGGFKEEFFIDSVDHDFCLRIKKNGGKMVKLKGVYLLHNLGDTKTIKLLGKRINCSNHSPLRRYYITRNRCFMRKIYSKEKEYMKYDLKTLINENIKILLFEKDRLNKFKMSIRGYRDYKKNIYGKFHD